MAEQHIEIGTTAIIELINYPRRLGWVTIPTPMRLQSGAHVMAVDTVYGQAGMLVCRERVFGKQER